MLNSSSRIVGSIAILKLSLRRSACTVPWEVSSLRLARFGDEGDEGDEDGGVGWRTVVIFWTTFRSALRMVGSANVRKEVALTFGLLLALGAERRTWSDCSEVLEVDWKGQGCKGRTGKDKGVEGRRGAHFRRRETWSSDLLRDRVKPCYCAQRAQACAGGQYRTNSWGSHGAPGYASAEFHFRRAAKGGRSPFATLLAFVPGVAGRDANQFERGVCKR